MSAKIEYTYMQPLGPNGAYYLEELEKHYYPSGGGVRQALFLCPVCKKNTFSAFIKDVKKGKTWRCKECKAKNTEKRFSTDLTGKRVGYLTVIELGERDNFNEKRRWICQCDCGRTTLLATGEINNGKTKSCGHKDCPYHQALLASMHLKDLTGQKFGKLTVKKLDTLITDNGPLWECDCDCGNKGVLIYSRQLLGNKKESCGCLLSKGEAKIQQVLNENNVKYQKEKTYENCLNPETGRKLRFDFYLPDYNCCIEYDGEQHFKEPHDKHWGKLEDTLKRDNIKNQYCKENNIKLIRIPYKDFNKIDKDYIFERIIKND